MSNVILNNGQVDYLLSEVIIPERINRCILDEDYGVSMEFEKIIDGITELLRNDIGQFKIKNGKDRHGKFEYEIGDKILKISWTAYYGRSREEIEQQISDNKVLAGFVYPTRTLYLPIYVVNGVIDMYEMYNTINHEMKHILQMFKAQKMFRLTDNYLFAKSYLYSDDEMLKMTAYILYASEKYEQEAFIEELWRTIEKEYGDDFIDNIVKRSEAYVWLKNIIVATNYTRTHLNNNARRNKIATHIDITPEKLVKLGEEGAKNLERRIGRIVYKAKTYLAEQITFIRHSAKNTRVFSEEEMKINKRKSTFMLI